MKTGDKVPDARLFETTEFGAACPIGLKGFGAVEELGRKRVVIFGLPGAYTYTCSNKHVPGYLAAHDALRAKGVDEIWCVSVNDGYVMAEWGRAQKALGKIRFIGDGNAEWTRKLGIESDETADGMGVRMQRFSMLVEDGVIKRWNLEQPDKFEVSDAGTMLKQLG